VNLWSRWNYLKLRLGKKADYVEYYKSLYKKGFAEGWLRCRRTIGEIATHCKNNGIDFLITIFPDLHNLNENYMFKDINALVINVAEEYNAHAYDLFDYFYGYDPESLWVSLDDTHPNAEAHKIIADGIYEYVTTNNLVTKNNTKQ